MIRISTIALATCLATGLPGGQIFNTAWAGDRTAPIGVVELFTSQGCNSCPPADAFLDDLAKSGNTIALGYHVDYWDYLGWRDTLGNPDYTQRQYGYAASFGSRSVYTPQAVVNGRAHFNGSSRGSVTKALSAMAGSGEGLTVPITVEKANGAIVIKAAGAGMTGEAHIVLVSYAAATPVEIERGENRGKTIVYANAVTRIQTVGMWHGGEQQYELPESEIMKGGTGGCAVLLQEVTKSGKPGAIIGAANIPGGRL